MLHLDSDISLGIGRRTGEFHRRRVSPANGMGKEDGLGAQEWKVHHRDDSICGPHRFVIICWPSTNDTICSIPAWDHSLMPLYIYIYQVTSYHVISYHIISYYTTTYCHATSRQCHSLFLTFAIFSHHIQMHWLHHQSHQSLGLCQFLGLWVHAVESEVGLL